MNVFKTFLAAPVVPAIPTVPTAASARIDPALVKQMKRDAKEGLEFCFVSVGREKNAEPGMVEYDCEAKITRVTRSKAGYKTGDIIRPRSYRIAAIGWAGSTRPPKLFPGWQGTMYLRSLPNEKTLHPAAYGDSFEPLVGGFRCSNSRFERESIMSQRICQLALLTFRGASMVHKRIKNASSRGKIKDFSAPACARFRLFRQESLPPGCLLSKFSVVR